LPFLFFASTPSPAVAGYLISALIKLRAIIPTKSNFCINKLTYTFPKVQFADDSIKYDI